MFKNYSAVRVEDATYNSLPHNQRFSSHITDNLLPQEQRKENYSYGSYINNISNFIKQRRNKINKKRKQQGRRSLKNNVTLYQEQLISLSKDQVDKCNLDDIKSCLIEYATFISNKYDIKFIRLDWHRDEGHFNGETKKVELNEHIHFIFENQNSSLMTVRTKMNFWKMQDDVAKIFSKLGFSRGIDKKVKRDIYLEEKGITKENYMSLKPNDKSKILLDAGCKNLRPTKYRAKKQAENITDISLDKENQKIDFAKKSHIVVAKYKDLQRVNAELREQLKASHKANQSDYKTLKLKIKILKDRIKNDALTIDDLKSFKAQYIKEKFINEYYIDKQKINTLEKISPEIAYQVIDKLTEQGFNYYQLEKEYQSILIENIHLKEKRKENFKHHDYSLVHSGLKT